MSLYHRTGGGSDILISPFTATSGTFEPAARLVSGRFQRNGSANSRPRPFSTASLAALHGHQFSHDTHTCLVEGHVLECSSRQPSQLHTEAARQVGRQVGQADHSVSKENPVFVHYWKHWITERQTIVCESANPVALSVTRSWPLYVASLWRFIPLFFSRLLSFFKINSCHLLFNSNPSEIERLSLDWNTADWCLLVPAWPKKKKRWALSFSPTLFWSF